MTPITHGMIGWIVAQPLERRKDRILVTVASVIPDLDGLGGIISIDYYAKYHHVFGHNFLFGVILSLIVLSVGRSKLRTSLLVFVSFNLHILADLLGSGSGWGVPYFWPISKKVFEFSHPFQWELDSWQNLLITALLIIFIIVVAIKKKRTLLEIFSTKIDNKIVMVFNKWFGS